MIDLQGKVAMITGGGRGLGQALCHTLSEAGMVIIPADISRDFAEKVALEVQSKGGHSMGIKLDVCEDCEAEEAVKQAIAKYGHLDVLVNNAAIDATLPIEELTVAQWDRIMATNLRGPFIMSKCALLPMKQQGYGHIVNITSTAAKRTWANASAYHASKWGLLGFSHALHVEARPYNVKVTAVVSGGMRTPFLLDRFPDIDASTLQDPRNVAQTIRFILSQPAETIIPEVMVIPMRETSWP